MATTSSSMLESKPRTRWLGQQVETDSEDEGDDIEVFWETTSIMSGVPTISPNKMATSTPRRTTSTTTTTTTTRTTHLAGQKRPANASPPPSHSSSTTTTKTASAAAAAAAASAALARRRKKRAGEGCEAPIGQAVDSKTLKMVSQLAIKFSTRSSSAAAANANASRQSVGSKKNHSAPHLPLRDSTASTVNVNSAMTTESKGKAVVRAATAPSGTLTATLDQQARTARRSPPSIISAAGIVPRAAHSTSHASSSKASFLGTSSRSTNALTTSVTRVEPIEESRPKSDDFDDLFSGDDSFEHILSQYDEESLISNATTIISSQSIGTTTACKSNITKSAVLDQKRSERILQGVGKQVTTKVTASPLPTAPTRPVVAARGASPRRSARAVISQTTKATAAPVTRLMTTTATTTMTKQEHPTTASTTKVSARPTSLQRTASSSFCSQAEAQERLQLELQSLAEQDVSFWSEESDDV